jgi:exopolyphosphatase/guanosine-5'-triphosphate,3'-diphosphate pyrophosphatase
LAVVDLGSNSGRVVVIRVSDAGHLEILGDARSPLRLGRELLGTDRLPGEALERVVAAVRDFAAVATGIGAERTIAVATSAIRESSNGPDLIRRLEAESGLEVTVIDGEQEARYAFMGAVRGLPIEHGMVADVGGGSVELTSFRERRPARTWTLPLGSLRVSDRFLQGDPPSDKEVERLVDFARETIAEGKVPELADDERLIGTGGTIRNLAKVDQRARRYPIDRLHGYVLASRRVEEITADLASRRLAGRRRVRGLNADRADSIAGGAVIVRTLMESIAASDLAVSGEGLREGLVYSTVSEQIGSIDDVRSASLSALVARFAPWDRGRADRRRHIATSLHDAFDPDAGPRARDRVDDAAGLVDIGRSIDYYQRFAHAADIVLASDLAGFSHRRLALLAAVLRMSGDEGFDVRTYRPLLGSSDRTQVARSAAILDVADEIEHRSPPGGPPFAEAEVRRRRGRLRCPILDPYRQSVLAARINRAFGIRLTFEPPPAQAGAEPSASRPSA